VYPRRLIFEYRRFGTIYLFQLQMLDMCTLHMQPLKMEQLDGSEKPALKIQTPGIHSKDYSLYPKHGESLKLGTLYLVCRSQTVNFV
jgi:hypothetical protein